MPIMNLLDKMWGDTGHGPPPTDDLTDPTRDAVFRYLMSQDDPLALTADSLLVAKICETQQYAHSVFSACKKAQIISASGLPDTTHIDSSFVSKIAIIPVPKQRELVNMLFWWEEEIKRLQLLQREEEEIEAASRQQGMTENLTNALRDVKGKKKILPSLRATGGTPTKD